jgi:hypothetical protein
VAKDDLGVGGISVKVTSGLHSGNGHGISDFPFDLLPFCHREAVF